MSYISTLTTTVDKISVDSIDPNPSQPRRDFNISDISMLAESIAYNGLLNPISVRGISHGRYELIAGERRLLAFKLLGKKTIPAIVDNVDEKSSAMLALVENIQRKDLNFFEEALAFKSLIEKEGLTQTELVKAMGMSQSSISNKLRTLAIPHELLQKLVLEQLTERHARALIPLSKDERLAGILDRIIQKKLNVEQTEHLVRDTIENPPRRGRSILIIKDLRIFTTTINKAITVMQESGIDAVSKKVEDEQFITYTIRIPKEAKKGPKLESNCSHAV